MLRATSIQLIAVLTFHCAGLYAQVQPESAVADSGTQAMNNSPSESKSASRVHRFWDTENIFLFAGVGGARMLDYASTRHLRNQGNNEWLLTNAIVDNRPLFVGIELAGTAASIGVSYLFHYTGHHSLERWTSIVHIGVGVGGSIRNYLLKPPQAFAYPSANKSLIASQSER
jgi:hypothetical protein